jgi:hypothetical protein
MRRLQFVFVKGWCKWLPISKKSALLEEIKNAWDACVTMYLCAHGDWKRLAREDSIHCFSGKNLIRVVKYEHMKSINPKPKHHSQACSP